MQKFKSNVEAEACLVEVAKELELLENIESRSDYEDKQIDKLLQTFKEIKSTLETPVNMLGGLKQDTGSDSGEVRAFNINQTEEFRSAIRSTGKSTIERPQELRIGRAIVSLLTGADCIEKRDMGTVGSGWVIGETLSAQIIPEILAASKVYKAGAISVPLTQHTTTIAKILTGPVVEIKPENIAFSKSTDVTFTGIQMIPVTIMGLLVGSRELFEDALNMEANIEKMLIDKISSEVDRLALVGGVGIEEKGISLTSNVLTEAYSSNYSCFSNAYYKLAAANIDPITGLILPSDMMKDLDQLTDNNDNYLSPPQSWSLYPKFISNQADVAIMGRFSDLIIGVRTELTIDVSSTAGDMFSKLQNGIRCYLRAAIAVRYPEAFCCIGSIGS